MTLAPLSDVETVGLLTALLERPLPEEEQTMLLAQAGGNPLYAEEYVRLLAAREEGAEPGRVPETVQGVIAARIDAMPPEDKELLQNAAVVGKVFWSGAVATLAGHDRWSVEERLLAVERRELIRRVQGSSVEGETQYAFGHELMRDVAYSEIPRAARSEKHVRAAGWIESLGRPDDHAEFLSHHYLKALEHTREIGEAKEALKERARRSLRDAGDRAYSLNAFAQALRLYCSALALWPAEDPERPHLLLRYGSVLRWIEDRGEAELTEARDGLVAAREHEVATEADLMLADLAVLKGMRKHAQQHLEHAAKLAESVDSPRATALVLGQRSRFELLGSHYAEAVRLGQEALPLAKRLGLEQLYVQVLNTVGTARARSGEVRGLADIERSLKLARTLDSGPDVMRGYNNLMGALAALGELRRERAVVEQTLAAANRYGPEWAMARAIRANIATAYFRMGDWDDALRLADTFLAELAPGSGRYVAEPLWVRGSIRLGRGDIDGALADVELSLTASREQSYPGAAQVLGLLALVLIDAGRDDEAAEVADELLRMAAEEEDIGVVSEAVVSAALLELGRAQELRATLEGLPGTPWTVAARHAADGQFKAAAEVYARAGIRTAEAWARLRAAERLAGESRREDANKELEKALAFYRSVGATHFIQKAEALLSSKLVEGIES
jgi:tetratricopeptide (TPR) repeat protein